VSATKIPRKNEEIKAPEVRIVDDKESQLGVMPTTEALKIARARELDLVEVSPKAVPPVCRIMDFGHFLYRQKKAESKQKRLSKAQETKELRFGIRISDHDFAVRVERAQEFLEKGHPVKVILQFRGRETVHADIGLKRMEELKAALANLAKQEQEPRKQGRSISIELRPISNRKG